MFALIELTRVLLRRFTADPDEAYLNDAVDLSDLERRMHEIDARGRAETFILRQGLFLF